MSWQTVWCSRREKRAARTHPAPVSEREALSQACLTQGRRAASSFRTGEEEEEGEGECFKSVLSHPLGWSANFRPSGLPSGICNLKRRSQLWAEEADLGRLKPALRGRVFVCREHDSWHADTDTCRHSQISDRTGSFYRNKKIKKTRTDLEINGGFTWNLWWQDPVLSSFCLTWEKEQHVLLDLLQGVLFSLHTKQTYWPGESGPSGLSWACTASLWRGERSAGANTPTGGTKGSVGRRRLA